MLSSGRALISLDTSTCCVRGSRLGRSKGRVPWEGAEGGKLAHWAASMGSASEGAAAATAAGPKLHPHAYTAPAAPCRC
jgi:hypothetical protein